MRTDIPRPEISINHHTGETFITCPFEHNPDGAGLVYEGHEHPRGFLHTDKCEGTVPMVEYLIWVGQEVGRSYKRP